MNKGSFRKNLGIVAGGFVRLRPVLAPLLPLVACVFLLVLLSAELALLVSAASERVLNSFIETPSVPAADAAAGSATSAETAETDSSSKGMGILLSRLFSSLTASFGVPQLIAAMLLILILNEALRVGTEVLRVFVSNRFKLDLQGRILNALLWEDGERRLARDSGSTSVIYSQDSGALGSFMLFGATGFLEHIVRIAIYAFGLSQLGSGRGWILVAIFLPLAILSHILVQVLFQKRENAAIGASEKSMMAHQSDALRFFGLIDKLVYLRGEKKVAADLLGRSKHAAAANAAFQRTSSIKTSVSGILATLSVPLVFLLAFFLKIGSPGEIVQMQMIVTLLMGSVGGLMAFPSMVNQYAKPTRRVLDAIEVEAPPDAPESLSHQAGDAPPALEVSGLGFAYPDQERPALDGVSFVLAPGEKLCLVANSGGGKSTLARLLIGDWPPATGSISLGGNDITATKLWHRRALIGYLPAEQGFLTATLADNIAFGRESATPETIESATATACLIEKMEELGDTIIHDPVRQLSTGEQRRVGVARLLCGDEPVWIFDEPTSGLDARTEREIAEGILRAADKRSALIITHDPHLFPDIDVLFLKDGKIEDRGSHEELLKRNENYRTVLDKAHERELGNTMPDASPKKKGSDPNLQL